MKNPLKQFAIKQLPHARGKYELQLKAPNIARLTLNIGIEIKYYSQLLDYFKLDSKIENYEIYTTPADKYPQIFKQLENTIYKIITTTKAYKNFKDFSFMAYNIETIQIQKQKDIIMTTIIINGEWYGTPTQN